MITVVRPGPLATLQDLGRCGYAALGVPRSGAFDRAALRLANRLVGNAEGAAAIEATLGGLTLRFERAATVALTGAPCPGLDWGTAVTVPAGVELILGLPGAGLRSYLAVRGGFRVDAVLGSRSTDTMSGLGPPPLAPGDRLRIGAPVAPVSGVTAPPSAGAPAEVVFGPRDDWFREPRALLDTVWTVRPDSDRKGVRLDGPPLERVRTGELASEPTLPGAIQVPGDGRPIVFGPDAPVTGGYPVIAVVTDLDPIGQLRPGDTVRFRRDRLTPGSGAGSPT